ncbi:20840_t:CDS:2 [Cetraspora pellucida]|uniref:20840_t:CDS:1 n=1 Tax=Cetraspora pellucida TaxID=1433469 RepID=A0A9N9P3P5_9GLOM|nr:20840_t:CDS:2 [Cetraspora pellucida]
MTDFPQVAHRLLEPIPQYVLGCLPAIAIAGASPMNTFIEKLVWMLRCLGCPFIGVFYSVNIGGKEEPRCLFWLPVEYFATSEGENPPYRPVGLYTMKLKENNDIKEHVNRCTAKASVLEKFSSIISMYYIVVGILAGISRTTGSHICEDWPYIPLLLSWTLPALCRRIFSGNLVVKDPKIEFRNITITMEEAPDIRRHKRLTSHPQLDTIAEANMSRQSVPYGHLIAFWHIFGI